MREEREEGEEGRKRAQGGAAAWMGSVGTEERSDAWPRVFSQFE